jgi:hypothetical protein
LRHGLCRYRLPVVTSDTPAVQNATTNLLDEVRKVKGVVSDYALAKLLAVRQQTITNCRSGRTQMNGAIAIRVARMMAQPPASLLAQLAFERAKDPEVAKGWKDAARTLDASPTLLERPRTLQLSSSFAVFNNSQPVRSDRGNSRSCRRRPGGESELIAR